MATVRKMLDRLASGRATLDEVATDFAARSWPEPKRATDEQAHGVHDFEPHDDNSWGAVHADSRLTPQEYKTLFDAYQKAQR